MMKMYQIGMTINIILYLNLNIYYNVDEVFEYLYTGIILTKLHLRSFILFICNVLVFYLFIFPF
jgi:hypothetical protein